MIKKIILIGLNICLINLQIASAATFVQCNEYVNIRKNPYIQSPIVGYIYNNNIIENIQQERQGWIKIQSGEIEGWIDKSYIIEDDSNTRGYTVAQIHPESLSVYIAPDKNSIIYTTVYGNQKIECVQYKNDWLTLAFEDGSYGFIDAYQAQLKTYYGTAKSINTNIDTIEYDNQENKEENYQQEQLIFYDYGEDLLYQEEYQQQQQEVDNSYVKSQEEFYDISIPTSQEEEQSYQQDYQSDEQNYNSYQQLQQETQTVYYDDKENQEENIIHEEISDVKGNNDIVNYADQFLGNPYVYGGNSLTQGIDCSHFVHQVLTNTGHYNGGYTTSDGWASQGEGVSSLDEAVVGDVIVYPGHVAIYDGEGGIVQAKGSQYGITHDRQADHGTILAIRRFN